MLSLGPSLRLALRCAVCDQIMDVDQRDEDQTVAALVGAVPYALCPGCLQLAPNKDDPGYRRRARVRHFERNGTVLPVEAVDGEPLKTPWTRRTR